MFCVECGRETEIYKNGVCIDCYLKTHSFTSGPEKIDIPFCSHCESFKYKNVWTTELLGDVVRRYIKSSFKISPELQKTDINTECTGEKQEINCKVYISGYIDNHEITEEHELMVYLKKTVCDACSRQYGGYHEAIIQVRTENRHLSKEEINNIMRSVESHVENLRAKGNRSLFITDMGEEHGGVDFFLSEKQTAFMIAKKIQEQYGGIIKQSSKNVGMKDSRQIYKMTYLVRLPGFKQNDFIKHENKIYLVNSIHGNKINLMDLSNWEEKNVDFKDLQKIKIVGGEETVQEMILVSQNKDEVQIMNPSSYEIKIVRKPQSFDFKNEKIKIVEIGNKIFLLKN